MTDDKLGMSKSAALEERPFVRRKQPLNILQQALTTALTGHAQVRLVQGQAGSGKTALLREFARITQANYKQLIIVNGSSDAQTGLGDPYAPFRQILHQLAGDAANSHAARALDGEAQSRLDAIKNLSQELLVELGPDLVGMFLPGANLFAKFGTVMAKRFGVLGEQSPPFTPTLFEEIDGQRIFEQYASLLRNLSIQRPLLLILDDLQWVDRASASLLFYLCRNLDDSRVLIAGLYRPIEVALHVGKEPHPLLKVVNELRRYHDDIMIDLDHISMMEGRQFVDALLDTEPNGLREAFRLALYEHTEGQALFTVELLRSLESSGDLVRNEEGRWVENGSVNWVILPARVEGVVDERIGRLDDELKNILIVASIEGQEFTTQVIAKVEDIDARRLLRRLNRELDQKYHLVKHIEDTEVDGRSLIRFRFSHSAFQQHSYRLAGAEQRLLHADVGKALEELYAGQVDAIALQLARHFEEARIWPKATEYLLQSGEQALRLYASNDAVQYFQRALTCAMKLKPAAPSAQLWRARQGLGELFVLIGQLELSREHLQIAQELAHGEGDSEAEARSCRWLARSYENDGLFQLALEWVARGLEILGSRITAETVQLRLIAGLIHLRCGEIGQAVKQTQDALNVAQTLGAPRTLGRVYLLLAMIDLQRGQNQHSIELAQHGLDLYTLAGDIAGQATAHNQIANALFNLGRWTEADVAYREAHTAFARIGSLYNCAFVENNQGEIALHQGRLDDALSYYQAALRSLQASGGSAHVLGVLHNNLGAVHVRRRELVEAREHLQQCLAYFDETQSRDILPEVHRHLAEIACQEHDLEQATTQGQISLSLAQELQAENEAGITQRVLGEVALAKGDIATAETYFDASLTTLESLGETYQAACTRLALAQLALAAGKLARARSELDLCGPVFIGMGAASDLAEVQVLWAKLSQNLRNT